MTKLLIGLLLSCHPIKMEYTQGKKRYVQPASQITPPILLPMATNALTAVLIFPEYK